MIVVIVVSQVGLTLEAKSRGLISYPTIWASIFMEMRYPKMSSMVEHGRIPIGALCGRSISMLQGSSTRGSGGNKVASALMRLRSITSIRRRYRLMISILDILQVINSLFT